MADEDFFKDYPPVATGDAEEPAFASDGPIQLGSGGDFGGDFDAPGENGGLEPMSTADTNGGGDDDASSDAAPECAAVVAWRAEFAGRLETKVREEREGKAARAEAAKAALEAMHASWGKRCAAAADTNASAEKDMLRDRDGVIARMSKPGEPPAWSVVPELVDMTGRFKEGTRDTSRMRQVLLKLKTY